MEHKFIIQNKTNKTYLTHDEDRIGGFSFEKEISEDTVRCNSRSDAEALCEKGEEVIEI